MSLVDYGSSSDDNVSEAEEEREDETEQAPNPQPPVPTLNRSNVVTEDIGKLFVRKPAEPSTN